MTRHRLLCGVVLTAVLASGVMAPARADVRVAAAVVVTPQDHQLETALAVGLLAAFFDVPVAVVVPLYPRYGFDNTAVLLGVSLNSGRSIAYCEREYSRGIGWGQVAHRLGVHPGLFNQQRVWAKKQDHAIAISFGDSVLGHCYGMPPATVHSYRTSGYSFAHFLLGLNLSQRTGHTFGVVLKSREREASWTVTSKHFGVTVQQARTAPPPKQKFGKAKGKPAGKGKPQGAGSGKPQGGGPGKGKGKPN